MQKVTRLTDIGQLKEAVDEDEGSIRLIVLLSRICPLGEMQSPPLDWTHDGNPIFQVFDG